MTSTLLLKDTSHATVFPVWGVDAGFGSGVMTGASDFLMRPDASTFKILPWVSGTGWLLCDIEHLEGSAIKLSTRQILKRQIKRMNEKNLEFICGLEVEFYVLDIDDPRLEHDNNNRPEDPPHTSLLTHGYQYLTENRIDQLDEVMKLLREAAVALDLPLRTMESEFGPSQFEFTFDPMPALMAADTMILFRNMVKQTCQRHGYHASFMCRPKFKNSMGNGWHLHQSVINRESGENLFCSAKKGVLSLHAENWIAGILAHAKESCLLSTPTVNGYKRYQPFALAPDRIQWGNDNRGAMLRVIAQAGDTASRIENRVGEPAANPYLYIASQIVCGLDGIENRLSAPAAIEEPYDNLSEMLPNNLDEATNSFAESMLFREQFGDEFVDYLVHIKRAEWQRYLNAVSEWEHREYFSLF